MISDLAKLSIKIHMFFMGLFRKTPDEAPIVTVIEDVISKITAAQNASRERIDNLTSEAADLLRTLTEKEAEQVIKWKREIEEFLHREGVDCACIDEFLKDPSPQKLEEFRIKYPCVKN